MWPRRKIKLYKRALHDAAQDIFTSLGPLNDLGPELSNTVANIYYRFHVISQNMANSLDVLGIRARKEMRSNFSNVSGATATILSEYKYIAEIIRGVRETKSHDPTIGDFLVTHALDEFKYHIKNAHKKSLIRRSIERLFCKVLEIEGLYDRMVQLRITPSSQQHFHASFDPIQAIKFGNLAEIRSFIQANPRSLDMTYEPNHWTLLHLLAAQGIDTKSVHAAMAAELLKAGADVNCRTVLGWTPIHLLAMQGQKQACELAKVLIAHGADLTAVDKMGADWRMHWQHGDEIRAVLEEASKRNGAA